MLRFAAGLCALLLLTSGARAQFQLIVVDDDGPADFAELQPALEAAAAGDVVLLQPGAYEPAELVGKGLTIVSAGQATLIDTSIPFGSSAEHPVLTVRDVPAGQSVLVAGMQVFNGAPGPRGDVLVEDCAGAVWLQRLFVDSYGAPALAAAGCASLVVCDTTLQTNAMAIQPDGTPVPGPGADVSEASRLFVHFSRVVGSHAAFVAPGQPQLVGPPPGGMGVRLNASQLWLASSEVGGGSGSTVLLDGCVEGGDGGAGLALSGPGTAVRRTDSLVAGGSAGHHDAGCAPTPVAGPVVSGSAPVVDVPDAPRMLAGPTLAEVGSHVDLELAGAAGDVAWLFTASAAAPGQPVGGVDLHLDPGGLVLLAALPLASASLTLPVSVPTLPPGVEAVAVPLQAVFVGAGGLRRASNPWAVVVH